MGTYVPKEESRIRLGGRAVPFLLLCRHSDAPGATAVVERLFAQPEAPWRTQVVGLASSPLLVFSAFRQAVLAVLRDKTPRGNTVCKGREVRITWTARDRTITTTEVGPLSPEPDLEREFRMSDEGVWRLRRIEGFPEAHLYYPRDELDQATMKAAELLERYGDRLRFFQEPGHPLRFVFTPLKRPATAEDVSRGVAIFSLTGERRVWTEREVPVGTRDPVFRKRRTPSRE